MSEPTIQVNCTVLNFDGNPPWLEIETTGGRYQAGMESPSRAIFLVPTGVEPPHGWFLEFGGKRERQPDPFYTNPGAYEGPALDYGASSTSPTPPEPTPPDEGLQPSAAPGDPQVQINCSVQNFDGNPPILEIETNAHRYGAEMESPERAIFRVPGGVEPAHGWWLEYGTHSERQPGPFPVTLGAYEGPLLVYKPKRAVFPAEPTTFNGRSWQRGGTPVYPWYFTLFWALGGWMRGDRARVEQHFQYISDKGAAGYRMLAQVNWSGEEIDPDKAGYEAALGEMLDVAWNQYNLAAKLTLIGGGARSPSDLATKVRNVVSSRKHTVLFLEGVNEQNANHDDAKVMLDILRDLNIPMAAGFGNTGVDGVKEANTYCNGNVAAFHTERGGGDDRVLRQVWDLKEFAPLPADDGEGSGPGASSEGECHDGVILAAKRAGGVTGGGSGSFCLHTGAGVFGRARPASAGREACPANIWETGNIEDIATRVSRACEPLEPAIENWSRYNTGMPVKVIEGPYEKHYGGRAGGRFAQIITACRNPDGSPAPRVVMEGHAPYKVWAPGGDVIAESGGGQVTVGGYVAYVVAGVDNGAATMVAESEPHTRKRHVAHEYPTIPSAKPK